MKKEEWLSKYKSKAGKAIARRSWEAAENSTYDYVNFLWHSGAKFEKILDKLLENVMKNKSIRKGQKL